MVESSESMPPVVDDTESAQVDAADPEDTADPTEDAVMEMPDDTAVDEAGDDEVPTLDTDDDDTGWSPVTRPSDEEEWD